MTHAKYSDIYCVFQMVQENKKLKRQSQQLLEQISNATTFDPTQLKFDTIDEVEVDDGQIAQLKEKIEKLESVLESSRDRCHELEEERVMLCEKEHMQSMEVSTYYTHKHTHTHTHRVLATMTK